MVSWLNYYQLLTLKRDDVIMEILEVVLHIITKAIHTPLPQF